MIKYNKELFYQRFLGDLVSPEKKAVISGPFGSSISKKYFKDEGIPVIRGNNLSIKGKKFIDDGFVFVTQEKANSLNCYAKANDIVFTAVGTIGQVGIIESDYKFNDYVISNKQLRVTLDSTKIKPLYAFYWFSSPWSQEIIKKRNVGSTVPLINLSILRRLPILLPKSVNYQNKVVGFLESIYSKIALNNKINAKLEGMAKLLYDYWFVQFDFPDAEGKPYKSSGGKMVYNEALKREIPEGWGDGELNDIANITMGQSPAGKSYNEEGIGMVFYQGSTDFGLRFPTNRKFTTQPSRLAKKNDVLLSVRAPVGAMNIANEDCCIGRGLAAINSKQGYAGYLNGVLHYQKQTFDRRNAEGTTFGSITKGDLFSLKIVKPREDILKRFEFIVGPMFKKQNTIGFENQKLSELRDWLLPMLMNGQVKVG